MMPFPARSRVAAAGIFVAIIDGKLMARTSTGKPLSEEQRQTIRDNREPLLTELTEPRLWRGQLIIPSGCADKYKWWRGGQSTKQTRQEVTP